MFNFNIFRIGKSFLGFVLVSVWVLLGCEQQQVVESPAANLSSVQVGKFFQLPLVDSLGNAAEVGSPKSRLAANGVPYVTGFSFPFGSSDKVYTQASDGDGWRNDQGLVYGQVVSGKYHLGEDWNAESGGNSDQGLPVYAMAEGKVILSQDLGACWGKVVIIRHELPNGQQVETMYGHLSKNSVSVNQIIQRRQQIGNIGGQGLSCSGGAMSAHLHLEARYSWCSEWGKAGPGYANSTSGFFAASSLVYTNFPTWPISLSSPADGASIRRSINQLFSWQNFWLLNAESRIQIASANASNASPAWSASGGFQSGLVYNQNIGKYNGVNLNFSLPGTYYWSVRSSNQGYSSGYGLYTSNFSQPRKIVVLPY